MGYGRTLQISLRLPGRLLAAVDDRARQVGKSRSDVIREVLEAHLVSSAAAPGADHPYGRVRDLLGSVSGGPPDLGRRHREHLAEMVRDRRR